MQKGILNTIGYQALFDVRDAFEAIEFGIEKGFSCVELNLTSPALCPENYSHEDRKKLRNYEFPILLHAPQGLSLFSLHQPVINGTLNRLFEIIDFGEELNVKLITIHIGSTFHVSLDGKTPYIHEILPDKYAEGLKRSLVRIAEYSKDKVPVAIENTGGFRYDLSHKVLDEVLTDKYLFLTWDIGHTNNLKARERETEEKFFLKFLNKVKNVHIHDNKGDWDEHAVIGSGTVDFQRYFKTFENIDVYFILETRPKEKALQSLEILRKMNL
ncbi:MAG TPA: sugar phosphate isomerase/epimerase [bacterium (Candidatus Stahlbacteria)]|nr:sugar phosphate isomerase/epimerase [Candidatus Stahlbacteria bacterium]